VTEARPEAGADRKQNRYDFDPGLAETLAVLQRRVDDEGIAGPVTRGGEFS